MRNTPIDKLIKNLTDKHKGKVDESLSELKRRFEYLDWKDQKKVLQALLQSGRTNTPIATLIKDYTNKHSRRVSVSRSEMQTRYNYLDWSEQKKIIHAFLDSSKTDRQWAYSVLLENWDNSFESRIRSLWEQFHEQRCSWIIIRYLPVEYVIQNINNFTGERDYFFICMRLAKDKCFEIDKNKLSRTDYLAVLYHTSRSLDPSEAKDILYNTVHDNCYKMDYEIELDKYAVIDKGDIICPNQLKEVCLVLYYIRKLNCGEVSGQFNNWNDRVRKMILESSELKIVNQDISKLSKIDYENRMKQIVRKYAYIALEEKYKDSDDPIILPEYYTKVEDNRKRKVIRVLDPFTVYEQDVSIDPTD